MDDIFKTPLLGNTEPFDLKAFMARLDGTSPDSIATLRLSNGREITGVPLRYLADATTEQPFFTRNADQPNSMWKIRAGAVIKKDDKVRFRNDLDTKFPGAKALLESGNSGFSLGSDEALGSLTVTDVKYSIDLSHYPQKNNFER